MPVSRSVNQTRLVRVAEVPKPCLSAGAQSALSPGAPGARSRACAGTARASRSTATARTLTHEFVPEDSGRQAAWRLAPRLERAGGPNDGLSGGGFVRCGDLIIGAWGGELQKLPYAGLL